MNKYVETDSYVADMYVLRTATHEINYYKRIAYWGRPMHQHPTEYQFLLVTKGYVILEIDGHHYELGAGDASIIGPGIMHRIYTDTGYEQVGITLSAIVDDSAGLVHLLKPYVDPHMLIHCPSLLHKADALVELLKIDGHFAAAGAYLLVNQILLDALEGQVFGATKRFDVELSRYLSNHLADKLTLKKIADHFHISISQLEHSSRKFFGSGVIAVYNQKRFNYAYNLLWQTEQSMNDIAQSIGFEDLRNFSAFISKHGKQSPSKIRKSIEWKKIKTTKYNRRKKNEHSGDCGQGEIHCGQASPGRGRVCPLAVAGEKGGTGWHSQLSIRHACTSQSWCE